MIKPLGFKCMYFCQYFMSSVVSVSEIWSGFPGGVCWRNLSTDIRLYPNCSKNDWEEIMGAIWQWRGYWFPFGERSRWQCCDHWTIRKIGAWQRQSAKAKFSRVGMVIPNLAPETDSLAVLTKLQSSRPLPLQYRKEDANTVVVLKTVRLR